jgi:hypothetical protein
MSCYFWPWRRALSAPEAVEVRRVHGLPPAPTERPQRWLSSRAMGELACVPVTAPRWPFRPFRPARPCRTSAIVRQDPGPTNGRSHAAADSRQFRQRHAAGVLRATAPQGLPRRPLEAERAGDFTVNSASPARAVATGTPRSPTGHAGTAAAGEANLTVTISVTDWRDVLGATALTFESFCRRTGLPARQRARASLRAPWRSNCRAPSRAVSRRMAFNNAVVPATDARMTMAATSACRRSRRTVAAVHGAASRSRVTWGCSGGGAEHRLLLRRRSRWL